MIESHLQKFLDEGVNARLFSGAAVAVFTPEHGVITVTAGTHSYGDQKLVSQNSLFDLASVSKSIVASAIVSLIEAGLIEADEPVAKYLSTGSGSGAESITLRHLLTHTAGLPSDVFVWKHEGLTEDERLKIAMASPLESLPDALFRYSCVGYVAAGKVVEAISGKGLQLLVSERVLEPLGLETMKFGPVGKELAVATEDESYVSRGMVRGEVHDELAWSLGGKVGNAGIFSNALDLLTFARTFLKEGDSTTRTILGEEGVRLMTESTLLPRHGASFGHGMGMRIADSSFMGYVNGIGHTGFTGTMFVVDRERQTAGVLLTNRVHPSRDLVDLSAFRTRFSILVASGLASLDG
jgi:CubicO group peptidase (beta-lactamase class C family)